MSFRTHILKLFQNIKVAFMAHHSPHIHSINNKAHMNIEAHVKWNYWVRRSLALKHAGCLLVTWPLDKWAHKVSDRLLQRCGSLAVRLGLRLLSHFEPLAPGDSPHFGHGLPGARLLHCLQNPPCQGTTCIFPLRFLLIIPKLLDPHLTNFHSAKEHTYLLYPTHSICTYTDHNHSELS